MNLKTIYSLLLVFILMACQQEVKTHSSILKITKDAEVHFEGTDENGNYNEHKIFEDPLAKTYEEGEVTVKKVASKKTITDNGPVGNRVNIVIVGDGYTQDELEKYEADSQRIADQFLDEEPFRSYLSYFNVHRVDVVSPQSGVSNDPKPGMPKSTALGMNYWCSNIERMLCANIQSVKRYAANAPAVDQILAIANSEKHGGAGYWTEGVGTLAGGNPNSIDTAIHEFGHIFGKLGDEYEYAGSNTSACLSKANGANTDALRMLQDKTKWFRWLDLSHINTFKGTCYSSGGYRPTANSKMRTLSAPFYEVNTEQLIFSIYRKVRPIDSATAAGTYPRNRILSVVPMKPIGHDLEIKWYNDGKEITEANQRTNFSVASVVNKNRTFKISVKVTDKTSKVRDEKMRESLMSETRTWTIRQ